MKVNKYCSVLNCKANNKDAIMHVFPNPNTARCIEWVKAAGNPKLLDISPEKLRTLYYICRKHFAPEFLMRNNRLATVAVPTLFLPAEEENADMAKNSGTDVVIREALREDMHQICKLIKDLAEFEKLQNQVKISPEILMKDGFDTDSPAFKCFVAQVDHGPIIGYALYYTCYSTWLGKSIFLEDLYVDPAYRKGGIGKALLLSVAKIAYATSQRLDFHVLSWNPAIEFYTSLGAINLTSREEWQLFRLDENSLNKLFMK